MAWFWTKARAGTTASAGTMTNKQTHVPSSGTEAAMATKTDLTQRRSARGHVWKSDQPVRSHDLCQPYFCLLCLSHLAALFAFFMTEILRLCHSDLIQMFGSIDFLIYFFPGG